MIIIPVIKMLLIIKSETFPIFLKLLLCKILSTIIIPVIEMCLISKLTSINAIMKTPKQVNISTVFISYMTVTYTVTTCFTTFHQYTPNHLFAYQKNMQSTSFSQLVQSTTILYISVHLMSTPHCIFHSIKIHKL